MSPSSTSPAPAAFSLFPSPNASKPPPAVGQINYGRRSESRERTRAQTPEAARQFRQTPPRISQYRDSIQPDMPLGVRQPLDDVDYETQPQFQQQHQPQFQQQQHQPQVQPQQPQQQFQRQAPRPVSPVMVTQQPPIRNSIAKLPLEDDNDDGPSSQPQQQKHTPQPLRSIFPTYNPDVPLDQQDYAPTQKSPTGIPRAIISRQSYHQASGASANGPLQETSAHSPTRSPMVDDSGHRWARARPAERPAEPKVSTTEQLKGLWKVTNGWKASSSEGRVYCMRLGQEPDAPVYTLFSASGQPMYNVRLDPTSVSARVTVMRHDPGKPHEGAAPGGTGSRSTSPASTTTSLNGGVSTKGKAWQEALTTTTEEEARRHRPEDGLVALLMPSAAARVAVDRANDPSATAAAELECARLVWDDDSNNYFLAHPALATPFCVTVDRAPAWSRVEYTLEHHESPRHLAKLTRDYSGGGWLEVDTGLASKIESFFIVDVAVTALMLVASADEKNLPAPTDAFLPPPVVAPPPAAVTAGGVGRKASKSAMLSFDVDVESQHDSFTKGPRVKVKEGIDRLPCLLRIPAKMIKGLFKLFIWVLTVAFKCLSFIFGGCYKVVGSKY